MGRRAKTRIHVNQHIIRSNTKKLKTDPSAKLEPPILVKHRNGSRHTNTAILLDANDRECARVVYRPHAPMACGARVWIETHNTVV